jgi:hypothetical protein
MGFEIVIYILRWVTKLIGKICDLPPAHPSSYFMTSPLLCYLQGRDYIDAIIGGGCVFIYLCSAQRISFESDCFYGMWT